MIHDNIHTNNRKGQDDDYDKAAEDQDDIYNEITQLLTLWTSPELDAETPGDLSLSSVQQQQRDSSLVSSPSKFDQTFCKCQKLLVSSCYLDRFKNRDMDDEMACEGSEDKEEEDEEEEDEMTASQRIQRNQKIFATILLHHPQQQRQKQALSFGLKSKQSKQRMILLLVQVLVSRRRHCRLGEDGECEVTELLMNQLCRILSKAKVPLLGKNNSMVSSSTATTTTW
jgi:hypothetical protein